MANLIPMDQAAAMLGVSIDKLTEMRSANEVFGYRDGATWKFKLSELERVAGDLGLTLNTAAPEMDLDDELDFELSDSSTEISSTDLSADLSADLSSSGSSMDILADSSEFTLESGELSLEDSGELKLEGASDILAGGDVLDDEEELSFGSSSLSLAASSSKKLGAGDTGDLLADDSADGLFDDSAGDTGKLLGGDDKLSIEEDDLFSDELELADSSSFEESVDLSSDFEDSDLVLDDSDSSAEISLGSPGSDLGLSANDSGLDLDDEPLELGGSDIDSLELPEDDDDFLELDDVVEDSGMMAQEDEFKLTALEEDLDDQSSGSQVIALEDSEIYTDESEATILADSDDVGSQPAMLPASDPGYGAEPQGSVFDQAAVGVAGATAGAAAMAGPMMAGSGPVVPEAPYSIWQVISLASVAGILSLGAIVGYDVARNLWMAEDKVISSGLLKFFLDITGMS